MECKVNLEKIGIITENEEMKQKQWEIRLVAIINKTIFYFSHV